MQGNPSSTSEDRKIQAAVLGLVLAEHPAQLTLPDISREIGGEDAGFADTDAIERAVRDLIGVGLLHHSDTLIAASRAALRFDELSA
jgi:hypothetical protein